MLKASICLQSPSEIKSFFCFDFIIWIFIKLYRSQAHMAVCKVLHRSLVLLVDLCTSRHFRSGVRPYAASFRVQVPGAPIVTDASSRAFRNYFHALTRRFPSTLIRLSCDNEAQQMTRASLCSTLDSALIFQRAVHLVGVFSLEIIFKLIIVMHQRHNAKKKPSTLPKTSSGSSIVDTTSIMHAWAS